MTEATLAVTAGSGTLLRTDTKTISSNTVHREFMLIDDWSLPTYTVTAAGVATTTAASHLMQLMAGSSLNVRIRRIRVTQNAAAGSVSVYPLQLVRVTTAGTGGTAITARPYDTAASAAGAAGMTLPSAKGTEGNILWDESIWLATGAIPGVLNKFEWVQLPNSQPLIIAAGTSNGIVIKNTSGIATSTLDIAVEFTETSYV